MDFLKVKYSTHAFIQAGLTESFILGLKFFKKLGCILKLCLLFKRHSVAYLPVELQLSTLHMTSFSVSHMRLHQLDFPKKLIPEKYIGFPEELCNSFQGLKVKYNYVCKCVSPMLCVFTFFYHPHFFSFFFLC